MYRWVARWWNEMNGWWRSFTGCVCIWTGKGRYVYLVFPWAYFRRQHFRGTRLLCSACITSRKLCCKNFLVGPSFVGHTILLFFSRVKNSAATNIMFSNPNVVVCVYICETYDHTIKTKREERQSHVRFWWFDTSACLYEKWKRNSTFFLLDSRLGFRVQNYIHINNFWFLSPKDSPGAIIKTPLTLNQVVSTCFPFSYNFGVHGGCHIRK